MRKLILSVAMLLVTSINVMAEDANSNKADIIKAYDVNVNINSLARYLELSKDQIEAVNDVQQVFVESLKNASLMSDESRKKMAKNAIDYDLKHMHYILTEDQYKKYVKVLNVTVKNRGILNK